MEKLKYWSTDIWSCIVSFFCWFTPDHCEHISTFFSLLTNIIGFMIALPTLIFITYPKVKRSEVFKRFFK